MWRKNDLKKELRLLNFLLNIIKTLKVSFSMEPFDVEKMEIYKVNDINNNF